MTAYPIKRSPKKPRPATITLWRGGKLEAFPIGQGLARLAEGWKLPGSMLPQIERRNRKRKRNADTDRV